MDDPASDWAATAQDAESAFATLSHDLRLDILSALWHADEFTLSFSDLRAAVGERDSGSFNYHLSQLEGQFVAKTEAGYELQYPGHRVLDAIQSGVFHEEMAVGPVTLAEPCRACDGDLTFTYGTDFIARVGCADCGERVLSWPFDPGGVADRDPEAIAATFDRRTRLIWSCALDGVCPFCSGRVGRALTESVDEGGTCVGVVEDLERYDAFFADDHPAIVDLDCERCSFYSFVPVGTVLLTRPTAVARLHEAGVDVRETPLWDLGFVVEADALALRDTDPLAVAVSVPDAGTDALTFAVDESLDVAHAPEI